MTFSWRREEKIATLDRRQAFIQRHRSFRGGELSDAAFGAIIDGMHEADVRRGGIGYLDPVQNRIATLHGFRSTFRDWAAEVAFLPSEIIEHALAHKLKDEAEAALSVERC